MFPKRSGITLLAALALAVGCGGDDADERTGADSAPATTAPQAPENPYLEKVSDDLRTLGQAAEGECRNTRRIRRALAKLEADADHLPFDATEALQAVDEVAKDTRDALRACRQQRELERAADELNKAADEIDQLGEEP